MTGVQTCALPISVYDRLYPDNPNFLMKDILDLLDKEPELKNINCGFERNAGMNKSLKEDSRFLEKTS